MIFKTRTQQQKIIQRFTNWCHKTNILTFCVNYRENTENLNQKMFETKNGRLRM